MQKYVSSVRHAYDLLVPAVFDDALRLADAKQAVLQAEQAVADGYRYVQGLLADPHLEDDDGLATMVYWETHFERRDELSEHQANARSALELHDEHEASAALLAGFVIELGKRGITMVHGGLQQAPSAPMTGTVRLRDLIWQGRNQAMHWEDGSLHPQTQARFEALFAEHGPPFDQATSRNLSLAVLNVLGWRDYAAFTADMMRLA